MNKDINKTLMALVPILRMNGENVTNIEAVHDWYKAGDREYMKEVVEITYDNGTVRYADIGCDSNLTTIYDVIAVIQQITPRSKAIERIERGVYSLPSAQPEHEWIPVTERLPENADHPKAFCPRYQVTTPYGVTEGWYRPHDHEKGGQWYALFWFMSHIYEIWNIDFKRGDVPKVIGEAPVTAWRPLPEAYKEVSE